MIFLSEYNVSKRFDMNYCNDGFGLYQVLNRCSRLIKGKNIFAISRLYQNDPSFQVQCFIRCSYGVPQ